MATVEDLMAQIRDLERRIEGRLDEKRDQFEYTLREGRVHFERGVRRRHRALRIRLGAFLARTKPLTVLTAPVIYSVIIGFVTLDILASLYQAICFPVYGIAKVRRRDYIVFDRHHLSYLNGLQKLNCLYCAYGNGLLAYVSEIAGRTEQYWCPIKHSRMPRRVHSRYSGFLDYGDAEHFQDGQEELRQALAEEERAQQKPEKQP